jgi:hypothetical protein
MVESGRCARDRLAGEVGDDPVLLPLLDGLEVKGQQLGASQTAPDQHRDHGVIPHLARG